MKRFLTIILLSVAFTFSAVAKSNSDPLIDFLIDVFNKKESFTEQNFINHGFMKEEPFVATTWNGMIVYLYSDDFNHNGFRITFRQSNGDAAAFLQNWRIFIDYVNTKEKVKETMENRFFFYNSFEVINTKTVTYPVFMIDSL